LAIEESKVQHSTKIEQEDNPRKKKKGGITEKE